jgi:hypothetical protein
MSKQTSVSGSENLQKRKFWQAHVKAWKDSNLSQAEYCRRQGLKTHSLCYWVNKKSAKSDHPLALIEIPIQKMPVRSDATLKLTIGNHYQIEIADHFSPVTLEQVLQVLRRIA